MREREKRHRDKRKRKRKRKTDKERGIRSLKFWKILFWQAGKTCLSNYLAEATESSGGQYHPTQGVRILEFEVEGESPATGQLMRVEVELWDCSGSKRYT